MEENTKDELKDNLYKCPNCGASLSLEDKKCAYCGSYNKFYKKQEKKDLATNKPIENNLENLSDVVGGFLGGVILNDIFTGNSPFKKK